MEKTVEEMMAEDEKRAQEARQRRVEANKELEGIIQNHKKGQLSDDTCDQFMDALRRKHGLANN